MNSSSFGLDLQELATSLESLELLAGPLLHAGGWFRHKPKAAEDAFRIRPSGHAREFRACHTGFLTGM